MKENSPVAVLTSTRQICTFYLNGHLFGVEVSKVQEVIRYQKVTKVPLTSSVVCGLINLRGQIVTVLNLSQCLGMDKAAAGQEQMNVVVWAGDGFVSLLVDDIGDVLEVSDESFEDPPESMQGSAREMVKGVYKLPNQLLLILDTEKAIDSANALERIKTTENKKGVA